MKLRFAVTEEVLANADPEEETDDDDIYASESLYHTPNAAPANHTAKGAMKSASQQATDGVVCRAVFSYTATNQDELSFPNDAIVTHVEKTDGGWWMGLYGEISGWFPSNYVEELVQEILEEELAPEQKGGNPLGSMTKSQMNCDNLRMELRPSTKDQRLIVRFLSDDRNAGHIDIGFDAEDEVKVWAAAMETASKMYAVKQDTFGSAVKKMKIAPDLSDLVFYFTSVKFQDWATSMATGYQLMSSYPEKKAVHLASKKSGQAVMWVVHNIRNFSRIYPKGNLRFFIILPPEVLVFLFFLGGGMINLLQCLLEWWHLTSLSYFPRSFPFFLSVFLLADLQL